MGRIVSGAAHASGPSLWSFAGRAVLLWVGTLFLILGLTLLTIGIRTSLGVHAYGTRGLDVQAVVLDKTVVRANRQDIPRTQYLLIYRFTDARGQEITGTADVPVEEWERLEPGERLAVTYLPEDPDSGRFAGGDEWIAALVFSIVGGVFSLLGGGLAFADVRRLMGAARVLRHGISTDSIVVRSEPTQTSVNRVTQWQIRYRYRDHIGRTQEGVSHLVSPEEALQWKEGDRGTVRFDRERPDISIWIGKNA